jgi:tyrosine-protein phosphatase YwqE
MEEMKKMKKMKNLLINSFLGKLKKNLFEYDMEFINPVTIDIHSHLLPGIDDGAKTMDETISIIKEYKNLGYTKLITTPHIISDSYPNTKTIINQKLHSVREAIKKENIDIEIEAAAEHYIDIDFLERLNNNEVLPFCEKYLLFETSYMSKPHILEEAVFSIQANGYIPVLAHPERYLYLYNDMDKYKNLKAAGVLFQINIKSLKNTSSTMYKTLIKLINLGYADFVGTDVHNMRDMDELKKFLKRKEYKNIFNKNNILNMSELHHS